MTKTKQPTPAPIPSSHASSPASANAAVARCCDAWTLACNAASASGKGQISATFEGEEAYRKAMPPLSGGDNIRDFIACAAHGMLIGAIQGPDGSRLLYAAQVAHCTLKKRSSTQKKQSA